MKRTLLLAGLLVWPLNAATKVLVTAVEQKSGKPITGLKAGDFNLLDDKTPRKILECEFTQPTVDVMLLLDTSLVGGMVQPVAENLISQLQSKEQMAIVAFHSSADLIQDFTSSRQLLSRALGSVRYGNEPRVLDALFAAIDGGFRNSTFRRTIVLLTAGLEGSSRTPEREVLRLARRSGVSIFPVYVAGSGRSLLENLARQTGGASFNLRDMERSDDAPPGPRVFEVLRSHYTLTVSGNLSLGERVKVEVKRPEKIFASCLPLD